MSERLNTCIERVVLGTLLQENRQFESYSESELIILCSLSYVVLFRICLQPLHRLDLWTFGDAMAQTAAISATLNNFS